MLGRRISLVAVATMLAAAGAAPLGFTQPAPIVTANVPARRKKGLFNRKSPLTIYLPSRYPRKDRMNTAAQHKRASKKARNVAKQRRNT